MRVSIGFVLRSWTQKNFFFFFAHPTLRGRCANGQNIIYYHKKRQIAPSGINFHSRSNRFFATPLRCNRFAMRKRNTNTFDKIFIKSNSHFLCCCCGIDASGGGGNGGSFCGIQLTYSIHIQFTHFGCANVFFFFNARKAIHLAV